MSGGTLNRFPQRKPTRSKHNLKNKHILSFGPSYDPIIPTLESKQGEKSGTHPFTAGLHRMSSTRTRTESHSGLTTPAPGGDDHEPKKRNSGVRLYAGDFLPGPYRSAKSDPHLGPIHLDSKGRMRTLTDATSYTVKDHYDNMDRVTKVSHPDATFEQARLKPLSLWAGSPEELKMCSIPYAAKLLTLLRL